MRASPDSAKTSIALLVTALAVTAVAWFAFGHGSSSEDTTDADLLELFAEGAETPDDDSIGDDLDVDADPENAPFWNGDTEEAPVTREAGDPGTARGSTAPVALPTTHYTGRIVCRGEPVESARVRLYWRRANSRSLRATATDWVTTDRQGRFSGRFESSANIQLELLAHKKGYAPRLDHRRHRSTASSKLDFGDLEVRKGARAIGTLRTPEGAPVAGARIEWFAMRFRDTRLRTLLEPVESDDRGIFEILDLPSARFAVAATTNKRVPTWSKIAEPQPEQTIDLGSLVLHPGVTVEGRVLTATGTGIDDVVVQARRLVRPEAKLSKKTGKKQRKPQTPSALPTELPIYLQTRVWRSVKTDEDGAFVLEGLDRSSLEVLAHKPEFLGARIELRKVEPRNRVDLRMSRRPRITGLVVDASTGLPLERYSIRLRRARAPRAPAAAKRSADKKAAEKKLAAQKKAIAREKAVAKKKAAAQKKAAAARAKRPKSARRPSPAEVARRTARAKAREAAAQRRRARDVQRQQRAQQAELARKAARERHSAWLREVFGPSGQRPRSLPRPTAHPGGTFVFDGKNSKIEPGLWLLDVAAEDFVSSAWGPIEIRAGTEPRPITIRLVRGATLEGRVVAKSTGRPVRRARVELYAPRPDERPPVADPLVRAMYPQSPGALVVSARASSTGQFKLSPQRGGKYRMRVRAPGFEPHELDNLMLAPGQLRPALTIRLAKAARIYGEVRNVPPKAVARVLIASTTGERREVAVDAKGNYEARDLGAGDWFVRLHVDGRAWGRFRAAYEALLSPGRDRPDVHLRSGDDRRFDLDALGDSIGRIEGKVVLNGQKTAGIDLELVPTEARTVMPRDPRRRKLVRDFLAKSLQTKSAKDGRFVFDPVPPGRYYLEARRHGRRSTLLGRRLVRAQSGRSPEIRLDFRTQDLSIEASTPGTTKPVNTRFVMALTEQTSGLEPKQWRKLSSLQTVSIRGGRATLRDVPIGSYEWIVFGGGYRLQRGRVDVVGSSRLQLTLERAKRTRSPRRKEPRPQGPGGKR